MKHDRFFASFKMAPTALQPTQLTLSHLRKQPLLRTRGGILRNRLIYSCVYFRKFFIVLLLLAGHGSVWAQKTQTLGGYTFTIETDTQGEYYKVDCKEALDALATYCNDNQSSSYAYGMRFKQTADIVYAHTSNWNTQGTFENNFTTIGSYGNAFKGTYDGGGYTISGIRIYKPGTENEDTTLGLFGYVLNGTVKNVTLTDTRIRGHSNSGGIVGYNSGTIQNCKTINVRIQGNVSSSINMGIISGYSQGTLTANYYRDCYLNLLATGGGTGGGDVAGARSVHTLTLADGVEATITGGESVVFGSQTYYAAGVTFTLSGAFSGTVPEGYSDFAGFSVAYGTDSAIDLGTTGGDFSMPASDAIVVHRFTVIPWGGNGTQNSPYVISYASQLDLLAKRVNGTHGYEAYGFSGTYFELDDDITYACTTAWNDAAGTENNYNPIGTHDHPFHGTFDGKGKTISGIRIWKGDRSPFLGLFGCVQSNATVKNVTLTDTSISGSDYVGGIAGDNSGTILNCHVTGTVANHTTMDYSVSHGGIAGINYGIIRQCSSAVTLSIANSNNNYFGAIAGGTWHNSTCQDNLAIGANVPSCPNYGTITGITYITLSHNYYNACTVAGTANATGVGCQGADVTEDDGAVPGYLITLDTGITSDALTVGAYHVAPSSDTVTLDGYGTPPAGYTFGSYSVKDADNGDVVITEDAGVYSFTMPAKNVAVSVLWKSIDWGYLQTTLDNSSTNAANPTVITLTKDVVAASADNYLEIPAGRHVILDLNGHSIDRNLKDSQQRGYVMRLNGSKDSHATLVIRDSSNPGTGKITGGFDGTSNGNSYAGGIYVYHGDLTLEGGSICGNKCQLTGGGGVYVTGDNSTFTMTGGSITGNGVNLLNNNAVSAGGAIYGVKGDIYLRGGSITGNYCSTTEYGSGGIAHDHFGDASQVHLSGSFTLSGNLEGTYSNGTWTNTVASDYLHGNKKYLQLDGPISLSTPVTIKLYSGYSTRLTTGWSTYMGTAEADGYFTLSQTGEGSGKTLGLLDGELNIGTPVTAHAGTVSGVTAYWTSFFHGTLSYRLPAGSQAYTMDSEHHLYRVGTDGSVIPAGVAVVIIADESALTGIKAGTGILTITRTNSSADVHGTNILHGASAPVVLDGSGKVPIPGTTDKGFPYVLSAVGSPAALGFYKYTGDAIPVNKAYYVQ